MWLRIHQNPLQSFTQACLTLSFLLPNFREWTLLWSVFGLPKHLFYFFLILFSGSWQFIEDIFSFDFPNWYYRIILENRQYFYNFMTGQCIRFWWSSNFVLLLDYEYSLWGLKEDSIEMLKVKHAVHLRGAHKLEELCFKNGGIYIKLGQHIGQLVCIYLHFLFHRHSSLSPLLVRGACLFLEIRKLKISSHIQKLFGLYLLDKSLLLERNNGPYCKGWVPILLKALSTKFCGV